jgi:hypothetical protein
MWLRKASLRLMPFGKSNNLLLSPASARHATCPAEALAKADAKRAAAFAAFLNDEVLEDVPHAMWVFTLWTQ